MHQVVMNNKHIIACGVLLQCQNHIDTMMVLTVSFYTDKTTCTTQMNVHPGEHVYIFLAFEMIYYSHICKQYNIRFGGCFKVVSCLNYLDQSRSSKPALLQHSHMPSQPRMMPAIDLQNAPAEASSVLKQQCSCNVSQHLGVWGMGVT